MLDYLLTDFVLVAVILLAHKVKLNPDNLATPLAASIGDLVALSVLGFISSTLFQLIDKQLWITFAMFGVYIVLLPVWLLLSYYNRYTRTVLTSGWLPILSALFISG
jgi:solute carrier family 41